MTDSFILRRVMRLVALLLRATLTALLLAGAAALYAFKVEPYWLAVRHVRLAPDPQFCLVHFSDLHYRGEQRFLRRVVAKINRIPADAVCFTGDLVEETRYADEALDILSGVNKPIYGVPGNHDHWSRLPDDRMRRALQATGGAWLCNTNACTKGGTLEIIGYDEGPWRRLRCTPGTPAKRVLITHYPIHVHEMERREFDLLLAGHTHGGQARLPFIGSLIALQGAGAYDMGLFRTSAGPLCVNPGIGTYLVAARFFCRPEITVIHF